MNLRKRIFARLIESAAMTYSSGMISEAVLGWRLDPRITLLSELAAKDREYRRIFQVSDLISGSLFVAAGIAAPSGTSRFLTVCLRTFGAATIADALSPLDYPISHEHLRPLDRVNGSGRSLTHYAHYLTTTVAGAAATGMCLHDWLVHSDEKNSWRRVLGPAVIVAQLTGVATLVSKELMPGVVQRIQTLGFSLLCLEIARHDQEHSVRNVPGHR